MSRIKNLKDQLSSYNLTLFDTIKNIDPSDKNTYCDLIFKHIKKRLFNWGGSNREEVKSLLSRYGVNSDKLNSLTDIELSQIRIFLEFYINASEVEILNKFESFRKDGKIKNVDLTKINCIEDLSGYISVVELKEIEKSLQKHICKLYEDDEWLCLKPLTFEASKKYGSNTKWCTTHHDQEHFYRYAQQGILIYSINKNTGYKVATFFQLDTFNPELSFWDQQDLRVDSLQTKLPDFLLETIRQEIKTTVFSNLELSPFKPVEKQKETSNSVEDLPSVISTHDDIIINPYSVSEETPTYNTLTYTTLNGVESVTNTVPLWFETRS